MKVLVAMSGGVDSSVTAALLLDQGHEVVGATMKLWGGASDSGCCSVSDVEDARRVAQQLDITHHVFNFGEEFMANVVDPYVEAHAQGRTPNPCVECNRHIKFDKFISRAMQLGFDAVATGHHARVVEREGSYWMARGADEKKDQSYVLHMLGQDALSRLLLPVGEMDKAEVRRIAEARGLRTASKPDSQDVCFITSLGGRQAFLGERIPLKPGRLVHTSGKDLGPIESVQLATIGQRKGIGPGGSGQRQYAVDVDVEAGVVTVGDEASLMRRSVQLESLGFAVRPVEAGTRVIAQVSAHGKALDATFTGSAVEFDEPQRRVAPGQSVVLYQDDRVLGGGIAV